MCHPCGNDDDTRMPLEIYPEYDLKTEVEHPLTKETVVVTGRADWAAGYDGRASVKTVLLCGEAKEGKRRGGITAPGVPSDLSPRATET